MSHVNTGGSDSLGSDYISNRIDRGSLRRLIIGLMLHINGWIERVIRSAHAHHSTEASWESRIDVCGK